MQSLVPISALDSDIFQDLGWALCLPSWRGLRQYDVLLTSPRCRAELAQLSAPSGDGYWLICQFCSLRDGHVLLYYE